MKASALIFSASMCVSGLALAQTDTASGVRENTDPAKIAEIERHAQELESRQQAAPTTDPQDYAKKQKKGERHHKSKSHKPAAKQQPPSDTPAATEEQR